MANKKPLYQPWSEEEFLSDLFVQHMTHVQRWIYRTLLQSAFFCSTRPNLPDDDGVLWMLAGCENRQQWEENMEIVRARFMPTDLRGQKVLVNKRLQSDWRRLECRRKEYTDRARKAGKASVQAKISKLFSGEQESETR